MIVPIDKLSDAALAGIVEEFVTRCFEEFANHEASVAERVSQVVCQLRNGEAVVVFDQASESVNIVRTKDAARAG